MHLLSLILHTANTALVFTLAWTLWKRRIPALLAAVLFGVHGSRPEVVVWTAGSFDLLACLYVLTSLVLMVRNRERRRLSIDVIALISMAAGILFKESAYVTPVLFLFLLLSCGYSIVPVRLLSSSIILCGALFAYRWYLFKGPGGYIDPRTGRPTILSLHLLQVVKAMGARIWTVLLCPVNWDAGPSWWSSVSVVLVLSALLFIVWQQRACPTAGEGRQNLMLLVATCCAVLPAIHVALIDKSILGARILYLPSIPFVLWVGNMVPGVRTRSMRTVVAALLIGSAGITSHNLETWHTVALSADAFCRSAAATGRKPVSVPRTWRGVFFFQNGLPECTSLVTAQQTRK